MIFKKLPEPHEKQEKFIKKILHLMFSAGKYRSTEKGYEHFLKYLNYFLLSIYSKFRMV